MKSKALVALCVMALLVCGTALVVWLRRHSDPPIAVSFVGYRSTSDGRVAVFRATNSSEQPFTFFGFSGSEPDYLYNVPGGGTRKPKAIIDDEGKRGLHTFGPHSSIEFTVSPPSPLNSVHVETPVGIRDINQAGIASGSGAFGISLTFLRGDVPSVHKALATRSVPIRYQVTSALLKPVQLASRAGLIRESDYYEWYYRLNSTFIRVSSDPATP